LLWVARVSQAKRYRAELPLAQKELGAYNYVSIDVHNTGDISYSAAGVFSVRAIKPVELRNNQKEMLDLAYDGEILLVARPAKKNVVVLSEAEFNRREKALRNAEYLAGLDRSIEQANKGEVVMYSRQQMRAMEEE